MRPCQRGQVSANLPHLERTSVPITVLLMKYKELVDDTVTSIGAGVRCYTLGYIKHVCVYVYVCMCVYMCICE